jgi:uncharacterized OB-fold protein
VTEALHAPHVVGFSYHRSTGGADQVFLAGLGRAEIWGSTMADGQVAVPPVDWDAETGRAATGFVRVADRGVVRSWTWVGDPPAGHPLDRPFALALIQLEGADTSLLHFVDAGDETGMTTGMAVRADWAHTRVGSVLDIRAFVPCRPESDDDDGGDPQPPPEATEPELPAPEVQSEMTVHYRYAPGIALSAFLRGLSEHRIEGGRCPSCQGVYVPAHPRCPACRTGPMTPVELGDRGIIVSYTEVHLPFPGLTLELPFRSAWIRLHGADVPFAHLLGEVGPEGVAVGEEVEAVWAPDAELAPTWESITYFRPFGGRNPGAEDAGGRNPATEDAACPG